MADETRRARDLALMDAIDAYSREQLEIEVWRVVRDGRDPLQGGPSLSRWCNGTFEVLYTALDKNGAIAEIHSLLSLQPVFPSKVKWHVYKLRVSTQQALRLADMKSLAGLGVDVSRYSDRRYDRTQEIADVANFLGFDGVVVPSARWDCSNLVLFTDRLAPDQIEIVSDAENPIDWDAWRKEHRK